MGIFDFAGQKLLKLIKKAEKQQHLKTLHANSNTKIHKSFKLGYDNFFDVSASALIHIAENVWINESNNFTVKKGAQLSIGKNTYITRCTIACLEKIDIGENCILGEGLKIFDHNHQYTSSPFSVSKTEFNTAPIKIGNHVWSGANVIILKGVTIGNNVILGAGCVVHKDVPDNTVLINKQDQMLKPI